MSILLRLEGLQRAVLLARSNKLVEIYDEELPRVYSFSNLKRCPSSVIAGVECSMVPHEEHIGCPVFQARYNFERFGLIDKIIKGALLSISIFIKIPL